MKNQLFTTIALIAGLGLAGSAFGRHDDFTGYNAHNAQKSAVTAPSATGGRHDEKPHGMTKQAAPANAVAKPAAVAPTVAPVATTGTTSTGL